MSIQHSADYEESYNVTHPVLVWLDLEMTGLQPETCAIVQMAMILTDTDLHEIAPPLEIDIWQPESVLASMIPFVREMHEKSGLLERIRASRIDIDQAEKKALQLLSTHAPYHTARLCGNSIMQDRRFLYRYMPAFESYMHYRQIDVSSIKELAGFWQGVKYKKSEQGRHTALFDIKQSIEELKYYRQKVFVG